MILNQNNKLLTIITVCYNSEKTIRRTIESVIHQLGFADDIEYLIIDGASKDKTLDIIRSYDATKIKLISEKDNGIYDAMNKGVAHATGKWIYFINSDDWLMEGILEYMRVILTSNEKYDCIYGDILVHKNFDGKQWIRKASSCSKGNLKCLENTMLIGHPALFVKKNIFFKVTKFDTDFKICGDWDFVLQCYLKKCRFLKVNKMISNFSDDGVSAKSHILERHKVRKKNGVVVFFDREMFLDIRKQLALQIDRYIFPEKYKQMQLSGYREKRKSTVR